MGGETESKVAWRQKSDQIAELKRHMQDEGEGLEEPDDLVELAYEMKVKLVSKPGESRMWVVPSDEDWIHDALDDIAIVPGTIYADEEPFTVGSSSLTGYFQADDGGRWVRAEAGAVSLDAETGEADWKDSLEEYPEVMDQLGRAMEVSEYRHVAEQASLKILTGMIHVN